VLQRRGIPGIRAKQAEQILPEAFFLIEMAGSLLLNSNSLKDLLLGVNDVRKVSGGTINPNETGP
jgi:hypothetical protein